MRFLRLLAIAVAAQPAMHAVMSHTAAPGHAHHARHAHHGTHGGVGDGVGMMMLHVGLAFVLAVVLRWGWVWLRTLPLVGRALVAPSPQWATPLIGTNRTGTIGRVDTMLLYDGEVSTRTNRGPPPAAH